MEYPSSPDMPAAAPAASSDEDDPFGSASNSPEIKPAVPSRDPLLL